MSRQSKNVQNRARALTFKSGGPKATTPKHGKNPANRIYTTKCRSLKEFSERNKGGAKVSRTAK